MDRPYDPETCRQRIREIADSLPKEKLTDGQKGVIIGILNGAFVTPLDNKKRGDNKRYTVLGWLFQSGDYVKPMKSGELSDAQWWALYKWVQPAPMLSPNGKRLWLPCQEFKEEALQVLNAALRQFQADERHMLLLAGLAEEEKLDG